MRSETLHAILPLAIVAGLAFALFSAVETLDPALRGFCSVSPFLSCSKVDQSNYTTTLGIPDYAWGIGGFAVMFLLDVQVYRLGRGRWLDALMLVSAAGFAFSLYFTAIELFVIHAFCLVCFASYLANAVVLVTAVLLRRPSSGSGRSARRAPSTETA
ncbi:MAG: vitamin K epoxide reductase family protein [Thermoplasmata archaeon]